MSWDTALSRDAANLDVEVSISTSLAHLLVAAWPLHSALRPQLKARALVALLGTLGQGGSPLCADGALAIVCITHGCWAGWAPSSGWYSVITPTENS